MRKLVGYACHRASVLMHDLSVAMLYDWLQCDTENDWRYSPPDIYTLGHTDVDDELILTLSDVAPRLADAIDTVKKLLLGCFPQ